MGFRVYSFEPVFENLQSICNGIYFNRVGELVTVFEAATSDRVGNITFHKVSCLWLIVNVVYFRYLVYEKDTVNRVCI